MLLRRITASFLVILFVVLAIPNFLIYGLSRTYLNTDFYRRDDVVQGVYEYALDKTVDALREGSDFFSGYFTPKELRTELENVFTKSVFSKTLADFADQIDEYKKDTSKTLVVSLRVLRENLLTVGNNLAYMVYQKLPSCSSDLTLSFSGGVPECVPSQVPYETVVAPITDSFEAAIYEEIPEELGNIEQAVPIEMLVKVEGYRDISFIVLVVLLLLMALVLYTRVSSIIAYIATSFLLSGVTGYGFSFALDSSIQGVQAEITDPRTHRFLLFLLEFLVNEIQRLSIIFVIVGIALYVIRFVLGRTVDHKKEILQNM